MEDYIRLREKMVEEQMVARGIKDTAVLKAMKEIPREKFVPAGMREYAYWDMPLPPQALLDQLSLGGRLVIPVGSMALWQNLVRVRKLSEKDYEQQDLGGVRFVPLIGAAGWKKDNEETSSLRTLR